VPLLEEIVTYMAANAMGTLEVNLFKGSMPDTPDVCTSVNDYGGAAPNHAFGVPGLFDEMPGIQVLARALTRTAAAARIDLVYKGLPKIQGITLSGTLYRIVNAVQTPFKREVDSKNRVIYAVNFLAEKEMSA